MQCVTVASKAGAEDAVTGQGRAVLAGKERKGAHHERAVVDQA